MEYNVLYFLDYGKTFGGAANTLLQQAILMKKAGHDVLLFVSDYYGIEMDVGYQNICENSGIPIHRVTYQICSHTEDIDITCILENYNTVKDVIQKFNPTLLHSIQINPIIELVSRELGIPHIMNIYQMMPGTFSIKYTDIFPKYHICDSEYYSKIWKKSIELDSVCIRTVANAQRISKEDISLKKEIYYVCVGGLCPRKNQLSVIKAFAEALKKGIQGRLILYGSKEGMYAEECKKFIRDNSLQNEILIYGFCDNMGEAYRNADVLICGSICESYPNVISEALANNLIIISTPVAGVPEVIIDKYNGYLCDDYTAESITEKIIEFDAERKKGKVNQILLNIKSTFNKIHSEKEVYRSLSDYYAYVLASKEDVNRLQIGELRVTFEDIVEKYYIHKKEFSNLNLVRIKLWYIYHVGKLISERMKYDNVQVYIWGTGKCAVYVKEIIDVFFQNITFAGFLDTYKQGEFLDKKIYSPKEILSNKNSIIFLGAINGQSEMIEQLNKKNRSYNKDYFIFTMRSW